MTNLKNFLIELLCGVRKSHSTQHVFFRLLQKRQPELGLRTRTRMRGGCVGIILMNFSKLYDCLSHNAKLEGCGLDIGNLNALLDYLSLKERRV